MLVTVNDRLKFEIEIVHDLSCHPIDTTDKEEKEEERSVTSLGWVSSAAATVGVTPIFS